MSALSFIKVERTVKIMKIRVAEYPDIESLVQLRLEDSCEDESCKDREDLEDELTGFFEDFIGNGYGAIYVAENESGIIATCGLQIIKIIPQCRDSGFRGYLFNMYTKPEFRCQGIQSELLSIVVDFAENRIGCVEIKLETINKNAISLYEKQGFKLDTDTMVKKGTAKK
jgi:ribosomal protein S18 acetylase RimI-like enzyme